MVEDETEVTTGRASAGQICSVLRSCCDLSLITNLVLARPILQSSAVRCTIPGELQISQTLT